ncbi:MAG: Fe-S protein assembly co-chaperone HscB [Gammaproteobacteria bacterium]|nr:Fe-S protein assembly co-chaperone HscB [Gammaproteobacteria bacterium]
MSRLAKNDFELFDIPPALDIDLDDLSRRYRMLQQAVHPDRFASSGDAQRRIAMQMSARVNQAYQSLKAPLTRLRSLLEIAGVDVSSATAALDGEFLGQQIELREELAAAHDRIELQRIRQSLSQACAMLFSQAADVHHAGDLAGLHVLYNKLQFMYRLLEELDRREETL